MIDFVQRVFHVASNYDNQRFINDNILLVSYEDGYWCGTGMYFWDNKSNAYYWLRKRKDSSTISEAILKCSTDDILDLTDKETCINLINSAKSILDKMDEEDRIKLDFNQTGAVINFVYNYYVKELGKVAFKVVKMQGLYGDPELIISIYDETIKYPHPTIRAKTIYAVRENKLLNQRQEVKINEF